MVWGIHAFRRAEEYVGKRVMVIDVYKLFFCTYIIIQNIFTNLNCDKNKDFL